MKREIAEPVSGNFRGVCPLPRPCTADDRAVESASTCVYHLRGCIPCGACRQFLAEFAPDMEVLSAMGGGRYVSNRLSELMPYTFNY